MRLENTSLFRQQSILVPAGPDSTAAPVAVRSLTKTSAPGIRAPVSYMVSAGRAMPARSASSYCESPAARRASRSIRAAVRTTLPVYSIVTDPLLRSHSLAPIGKEALRSKSKGSSMVRFVQAARQRSRRGNGPGAVTVPARWPRSPTRPLQPPKLRYLVRIFADRKEPDHLKRFFALFGTRSSLRKSSVPAHAHETHFLVQNFSDLKILPNFDALRPSGSNRNPHLRNRTANHTSNSPEQVPPTSGRTGAPPLRCGLPPRATGKHLPSHRSSI